MIPVGPKAEIAFVGTVLTLLYLLFGWLVASEACPNDRERWLDEIEKHGYVAYVHAPAQVQTNAVQLSDALVQLNHAGFIVTDANGTLIGNVTKARPSGDEADAAGRSRFRLVDERAF